MFNVINRATYYKEVYKEMTCIIYTPDGRIIATSPKYQYPRWVCSVSIMAREDDKNHIEALKKAIFISTGLNLEKTSGVFRSLLTFNPFEHGNKMYSVYDFTPTGNLKLSLEKEMFLRTFTLKELKLQLEKQSNDLAYTTEIVLKKIFFTKEA